MLLPLLLTHAALAADTTFLGALESVTEVEHGEVSGELQAEVDVAVTAGSLVADVQLDVKYDPFAKEFAPFLPEKASLAYGTDTWGVEGGMIVPALGLEGWDTWDNAFPSFSNTYTYGSIGHMAGGSMSYAAGPGKVFAFGGVDFDRDASAVAGAGFTADTDAWSTWSGVAAWPELEMYTGFANLSTTPVAWLGVALDSSGGMVAKNPWASGQVVLTGLPDAEVHPLARVEATWDPDHAALGEDAMPFGVSLGAGAHIGWIHAALEGKLARHHDAFAPVGTLSLTVLGPPAHGAATEGHEGAEAAAAH